MITLDLVKRINEEVLDKTDYFLSILEQSFEGNGSKRRTALLSKVKKHTRKITAIPKDKIENIIEREQVLFETELTPFAKNIASSLSDTDYVSAYRATESLVETIDEYRKFENDMLRVLNAYTKRYNLDDNISKHELLTIIAREILASAILRTPIVSGNLRRSAVAWVPPDNDAILIFYAKSYAKFIHEAMFIRHPIHRIPGSNITYDCHGDSKFLEDAVQLYFPDNVPEINKGKYGPEFETTPGQLWMEIPINWGNK